MGQQLSFMQTIPERIAELNQALERHKQLALLLTSWSKADEAIIERCVKRLQSIRQSLEQLEREMAEAEAALAKLTFDPPVGTDAAPVPPKTENK